MLNTEYFISPILMSIIQAYINDYKYTHRHFCLRYEAIGSLEYLSSFLLLFFDTPPKSGHETITKSPIVAHVTQCKQKLTENGGSVTTRCWWLTRNGTGNS